MLTPGLYTQHPRCPHLIRTLQRVVDEVSVPMWMPGQPRPATSGRIGLGRGSYAPRALGVRGFLAIRGE